MFQLILEYRDNNGKVLSNGIVFDSLDKYKEVSEKLMKLAMKQGFNNTNSSNV